jgi:hypothetical protein
MRISFLIEAVSELLCEFSQPVAEFAASDLEVLLWLSRQHAHWYKHQPYASAKQTSCEVLYGLSVFLALNIHRSCLSFLLLLAVYHAICPFSNSIAARGQQKGCPYT